MFTLRRASFSDEVDIIPNIRDLFQEHWQEIGLGPASGQDLNIYDDFFKTLERHRYYLSILIEYEPTNEVVGYLSVFVSPHQHLKDTMIASTDSFFISKKHRGFRATKAMIDAFVWAEELLTQEFQAQYFQLVDNVRFPQDKLAKHLGFIPANTMYMKRL